MTVPVETERLTLRPWIDADVEPMIAIFGDAETVRYVGKGYQRGFTADETRKMVARMRDRCERDSTCIWPVILKQTGALIGECGLFPVADSQDIEIAYVFAPEARGRGYAVEAGSAVLAYAFETLGLRRVVALVHAGNARSIAVIRRLGMRFDRVVRVFQADALRYVIDAR
ncbi:MAG TPA: GNAT family N-acetyltransferase [Candidatus Tumulicola sp.]